MSQESRTRFLNRLGWDQSFLIIVSKIISHTEQVSKKRSCFTSYLNVLDQNSVTPSLVILWLFLFLSRPALALPALTHGSYFGNKGLGCWMDFHPVCMSQVPNVNLQLWRSL